MNNKKSSKNKKPAAKGAVPKAPKVVIKKRSTKYAEIPECRDRSDLETEYKDFPEEKLWSPRDEVNEWAPFYTWLARSVLTLNQESKGISNAEAMENSCTGYAEQYINDVLHESKYVPEEALKTLFTKELPSNIYKRWSIADIELFIQGVARHGKNFANIQKNFLPMKNTNEVVEFYYAWKWSEAAKELRNFHGKRHLKLNGRLPSIDWICKKLASSKIVTQSLTAAARRSSSPETNKAQEMPVAATAGTSNGRTKRKRTPRLYL